MSDVHALPDEGDRGLHMARRLRRSAADLGVGADGLAVIEAAHVLAMEPRRARLGERDAAFLHPGRSALVLLLDVEVRDAEVLAAAILAESGEPLLRVPSVVLGEPLPTGEPLPRRVRELRDAVPPSGDPALAEELVAAGEAVRLVALAERLDHLRHAHLWDDRECRRRAHEEAAAVYGPMAERTHPVLSRRYRWWIGMFGRRHLG